HAEDPRQFTKVKVNGLEGHSAARPKAAESSALRWLASNRREAKVHIAHVTCVEALDSVPSGATCEATPHHLFLDTSSTLGARRNTRHPERRHRNRAGRRPDRRGSEGCAADPRETPSVQMRVDALRRHGSLLPAHGLPPRGAGHRRRRAGRRRPRASRGDRIIAAYEALTASSIA